MSLVKGENWVGYAYDGGIWKPFVCARSGNVSVETELAETTVTGSGNWKTFEPTVHSFSASIDGIVSLNVSGSLTLPELQALQFAKTKILWRFMVTAQDGTVYRKEAYLFITNSTDTGSFDGIATFSLSLKGTGAITQIFTPPSPTTGTVYRYPAVGSTAAPTSGSTAWLAVGLGNKNILELVKDGRGLNNIILSGTPVGNEVLYETIGADGLFTTAFPYEDGETPPYTLYQNV